MVMTVSISAMREHMDEILATAQERDQSIIVENNGEPVAVVVQPETFNRLRAAELERAWDGIDNLRERNAHLDPEEVISDVTAIVEEVRHELHAERQPVAAS